ncbi:hypothetical protein L1049_011964 [Liquidambar formosana]|uniref:Uncharacterized protein n=1 Tax=Liquidambar formosana TaxID=63359 RepID=A0AAP0RY52_LIQFO
MEAEDTSSCSYQTNWTVADGSLAHSVTFESSVSPIDEDAVSTLKSPLLLRPPSPDSGPCEIKITFLQKHEVRQVYVRSTARVYEIYYAPNLHSSNEYLCTVRCSIATKDEELLHAADIEEAVSSHLNGSNKQLAEEKSKSNSNTSTSEDDWVEVKVPDSPLPDSTNSSLPSKIVTNPGKSTQDFYEATAEISDADPCISLTLRLLSLQNKECIYVDEVYVFADPVESSDSENQVGRVENSAGSSLMAMLVPTILQLSKTGNSRIQDKHTFDMRETQKFQEIRSKASDSTNIANTVQLEGKSSIADQQEVKLQEPNGAIAQPAQFHIPKRVPDMESKPDSFAKEQALPYMHFERAMDQLFSRMGKIEDLCLRFEENMLKPISNIEARLQRVEQQLEVLTKNSQNSGFPSGTRFSAPEFSCNESGSNSFYNDGSDYPSALESDKKDIPCVKISIPPDDMSVSVNVTQLLPSLVVTAPEFSNGDDEEEN